MILMILINALSSIYVSLSDNVRIDVNSTTYTYNTCFPLTFIAHILRDLQPVIPAVASYICTLRTRFDYF